MKNEEDDPLYLLAAIVVGGTLLLGLILSCFGCASVKKCPECIPETEIVEVLKPVRSCPAPPDIPELELPEYPEPPDIMGLSDKELEKSMKDWYAEVVATVKSREALFQARIDLLRQILDSYSPISE